MNRKYIQILFGIISLAAALVGLIVLLATFQLFVIFPVQDAFTYNETADWKTYESAADYGFKFDYPSYLELSEVSLRWITLSSSNVSIDIQVDESLRDVAGNKITLEGSAKWLATNGKNVIIEKTSVDGVDARKISQDIYDAGGMTHSTIIVARKNDKTYVFRVINIGYNSTRYSDEDFYKILSTFKFTK